MAKLPLTGIITLESDEQQWELFVKGFIGSELKMTALVQRDPGDPSSKGRINLVINTIYSPENSIHKLGMISATNLKETAYGISRIDDFLYNHIYEKSWLFIGFIVGGEPNPVVIFYSPTINLAIYSQKRKNEIDDKFFPHHMKN